MNDDDLFFIRNELRITCADAVELMTDYLDEALSPADLEHFETHLSLCEGCQAFLDQINRTITLTSASATTTVDVLPGNFDELLAAFEAATPPQDGTAGEENPSGP